MDLSDEELLFRCHGISLVAGTLLIEGVHTRVCGDDFAATYIMYGISIRWMGRSKLTGNVIGVLVPPQPSALRSNHRACRLQRRIPTFTVVATTTASIRELSVEKRRR